MRTMIDCITNRRCWLILAVFAIVATMAALTPSTALAQANCLQDEYTAAGNNQTLNCTANDVRVAKVINIRDLSGNALTQCVGGGTINFIADYLVQTTSTSSRSNIGLYFDTGNVNTQTNALSGSCSDNIIWPVLTSAGNKCGSDTLVACGTTHRDEFDGTGDNCGDTSSSDPAVCLNTATNTVQTCTSAQLASCTAANGCYSSTQVVTVEIHNFPCIAPAGTTSLVLPNCTSWQVPGKTITCEANAPYYQYPSDSSGKPEAIPGSPSKCNCETIPLGILVQTPSIDVGKTCNTTATGATPSFDFTTNPATASPDNCDAGLEGTGGPVTYTVQIKNQSNTGGTTINQICDSKYGTLYRLSTLPSTFAACAAGSTFLGVSGTNTCPNVSWDIAKDGTQTCTFQGSTTGLEPPTTIQDTVSATGTGDLSGTAVSGSSGQVTVFAQEAPSTATVTKSYNATAAACATVRYKVDVKNTTSTTYDEDLSLSGLSDTTYGNITAGTTLGANVLGTTCGVATSQNGTGTLSNRTGDGVFPYALTSGGNDYVCYFDAQFCSQDTGGVLGSIVTTAGTCSTGNTGTPGTCTAGQTGSGCTSNAQCNVSCTGIQNSDSITATISSGETGENVNGVCNIPTGSTTGTCTQGLVGSSCTTNADCNALTVTANTLNVNECITQQ